jgi:Arc/MetJ family transcription regulator
MRTTLTLDDDVSAALDQLRRTRSLGLKEAVNEAMRRGLRSMTGVEEPRAPFVLGAARLGAARVGLDNVAEALAAAEREDFR